MAFLKTSRAALAAAALLLFSQGSNAQTSTKCNPVDTTCPADPALGKSISIDFTQGPADEYFTVSGTPTYDANGVGLAVGGTGQAPTLTSKFFIMFGRVEVSLKAAPGNGIVSSLVFQSDDLDEIDCEFLGYDGAGLQTMYFDQGVGDPSRLDIVNAPNNQGQFNDYVVDWNSERIQWIINGNVVRTLPAGDATAFPQTPMMIKIGSWSAGDPSTNSPGTVEWAHGPTDYSQGPFAMYVKTLQITDYSTGSEYVYGDHSGTWQSIKSVGGTIQGNPNGSVAAVSSSSSSTTHSTTSSTKTSTTTKSSTTSTKTTTTSHTSTHTTTTTKTTSHTSTHTTSTTTKSKSKASIATTTTLGTSTKPSTTAHSTTLFSSAPVVAAAATETAAVTTITHSGVSSVAVDFRLSALAAVLCGMAVRVLF